jgi:hypothetical protein
MISRLFDQQTLELIIGHSGNAMRDIASDIYIYTFFFMEITIAMDMDRM